jgi:hypothetical protein
MRPTASVLPSSIRISSLPASVSVLGPEYFDPQPTTRQPFFFCILPLLVAVSIAAGLLLSILSGLVAFWQIRPSSGIIMTDRGSKNWGVEAFS